MAEDEVLSEVLIDLSLSWGPCGVQILIYGFLNLMYGFCFEKFLSKSLDKTWSSGVGSQGKVVDLVLSSIFPWEPMSEDEVLSRVLVDLWIWSPLG